MTYVMCLQIWGRMVMRSALYTAQQDLLEVYSLHFGPVTVTDVHAWVAES